MADLPRHTPESLFKLLSEDVASTTLSRKLVDWLDPQESDVVNLINKLVVNDYTMQRARDTASTASEFLHLTKVLAQKRREFFRRSSPLRYMMDYMIENILQWEHMLTTVGYSSRCGVAASLRTIYRKTSVCQDQKDQEERRRLVKRKRDARKRKRKAYVEDRKYISCLKQKIKRKKKEYRQYMSILHTSERFANSKRKWDDGQRDRLRRRMENVDKRRFFKMKAVIEFYIPPTKPNDVEIEHCDPHMWTVQTCRHVSHVIR